MSLYSQPTVHHSKRCDLERGASEAQTLLLALRHGVDSTWIHAPNQSGAPNLLRTSPSISPPPISRVTQMGGEGPYLRFNEGSRLGGASTTPPSPLDDKQLDEAYTRAHVFLLERVRQLVKLGWEQHKTDGAACGLSFHRPGGADDVIRRFLACVPELHVSRGAKERARSSYVCRALPVPGSNLLSSRDGRQRSKDRIFSKHGDAGGAVL